MIENFESEFLAFCRAKPAEEEYKPHTPWSCALGQFAESKGYVGRATGYVNNREEMMSRPYPEALYVASVNTDLPTFGALVQRLEAAGVK